MIITELKDIIGSLKADHVYMEECLNILQRFKQYLIRGLVLPTDDYLKLLDLIQLTVVDQHNQKLQKIVFPAIANSPWLQSETAANPYFIRSNIDPIEKIKTHLTMVALSLNIELNDPIVSQLFSEKSPFKSIIEEQFCTVRLIEAMKANAKDDAKSEMLIGDMHNLLKNQFKKELENFLPLIEKNISSQDKNNMGQKASEVEGQFSTQMMQFKTVMEELKKKHLR